MTVDYYTHTLGHRGRPAQQLGAAKPRPPTPDGGLSRDADAPSTPGRQCVDTVTAPWAHGSILARHTAIRPTRARVPARAGHRLVDTTPEGHTGD